MENKPDIVTTIEHEGFPITRKGRTFWLSCPFHEDKHPSFKINPDRQTFYCFSCNSGGDSIAFVQKLHGLSFKEALKHLNLEDNPPVRINPREQTKRQLLSVFRSWEKEYLRQLTDVYRVFHELLKDCKTMEEVGEYAEDFDFMNLVDHHWKILFYGTDKEKFKLFQGVIENGKL